MVGNEENFKGMDVVDVESCKGVSDEKKRFLGVSKMGNRWQARVRHPKLKFEIYLGCYGSPEEAAFVVKKKKAEFEDMFKGEDETCRGENQGRELPPNVYRRGYERWGARMWNPMLKKNVSLGSYKTVEAAAAVVNEKRAEFQDLYRCRPMRVRVISDCEYDDGVVYQLGSTDSKMSDFWKMYGCRKRIKSDCEDDDKVLEKLGSEVVSTSECLSEQTGDLKVPAGVRRLKSGKWGARITDPVSRTRIWLGSYDTAQEAVRSFNRKKAALYARRNAMEFDESGFRYKEMSCSVAECEFGQTSILHVGKSNSIAVGDKSIYEVIELPNLPNFNLVNSSMASVLEAENLSSADLSDKFLLSKENRQETEFASDFDEAVSLGFIDEYGQLLGKYSELDEQLDLRTL